MVLLKKKQAGFIDNTSMPDFPNHHNCGSSSKYSIFIESRLILLTIIFLQIIRIGYSGIAYVDIN